MKVAFLKILFSLFFLLAIFACRSQNKQSNTIGKSKFGPLDTSLPVLKSGFYLLSKVKKANTVYRKFYIALDEDPTGGKEFYYIITNDFVDFSNVDSIYTQKEDAPYENLYRINLKLNDTGRKQFLDMTGKSNSLSRAEKYEGLVIGTVIHNTLIHVMHAFQPVDTNTLSISGVFDKEDADDLKKILEKGKK